ncbi:beta-ketoacyl-ACP synthase III [Dendronalium sp. ChiSLP03b]|uniref:beta-ketoacyl-ACP synthase III n=1 Tax=Dendronalium sp. ChiSLP03b TaxID=3075381 RepID=UPI002AD3287E|nr:beta-ketoacyl-ACP synthase III [Dendronalium sp. ChiSLP03b]MDZ8203889.1 beta-ketoacyl-ACP synthase III [Dendronalium sp. ChiSLP03b]
MVSAYITGIGVFLPNEPINNEEIENVLGLVNGKPSRSKSRILKNNGIKSRYYAIDPKTGKQTHNNAQLTAEAVHNLSKDYNLPLEKIECLVCGTSGPDQFIPNHALMVHGELGCPPCEVIATSGVCCAGVTAFKYGYMSVSSGLTKNAVTTGSELVSNALTGIYFQPEIEAKIQDLETKPIIAFEKDFLRWMLSDAAAAVLITDTPRQDGLSLRIDWIDIISFANELDTCMYMGAIKKADGSLQGWREVENPEEVWQESYFALKQDAKLLGENVVSYGIQKGFTQVRDKHNLKPDDITWYLPHYSSEHFKQSLYDELVEIGFHIPFDKWFTNLTYKGNTGSASIFVMLEELMSSGKVERGDKIFCLVPESARFSYAYMHLTAI